MALRTHCGLLMVLLMETCSIRGYVMRCGTFWATVLHVAADWRHDDVGRSLTSRSPWPTLPKGRWQLVIALVVVDSPSPSLACGRLLCAAAVAAAEPRMLAPNGADCRASNAFAVAAIARGDESGACLIVQRLTTAHRSAALRLSPVALCRRAAHQGREHEEGCSRPLGNDVHSFAWVGIPSIPRNGSD